MRLVSFLRNGASGLRAGALLDNDAILVDIGALPQGFPCTMRTLLEVVNGDFRELAEAIDAAPPNARTKADQVKLGPVVPDPEKVMCIGLNYRDHAAETNHAVPDIPTVFAKYRNTLVGCGDPIEMTSVTNQVDYEAELAVVIGRSGKSIDEAEAMRYVAGYTIFNDVSARDFQLRVSQWTMGKSFDTFGPLGPYLVTKDEVPDPHSLRVQLRVGNEVLQDSNTGNMVFTVAKLVSFLSSAMTLVPGDVIATGTPAGVGFTRKPPRFLRPGETVEIEIERLGKLWNPVRRRELSHG